MNPIATASDVRTAGALLTDAQGGASDAQVNAALGEAMRHMMDLVGKDIYIATAAFDEESTEKEQTKKESFALAEARFALSFLPHVLTGSQLEKTGFKKESQIGRAVTTYGNEDDIIAIADDWASRASLILSPYLKLSFTNEDTDKEYGMKTKDEAIGIFVM